MNYRLLTEEIVALLPARLAHEKNVLGFLESIKEQWPKRFRLLIAGDGPLRHQLEQIIRERKMDGVHILGHRETDEMVELYAIADMLVLPSLRDSNPLAVIEALWAGLPLLVSRRVGNLPEALADGENGWSFDPDDPNEVIKAVTRAVSAGRDRLKTMGQPSREIARLRFESKSKIAQFFQDLIRCR